MSTEIEDKASTEHVEAIAAKWDDVKARAERDEAYQKGMTLRQALKTYRKVSAVPRSCSRAKA